MRILFITDTYYPRPRITAVQVHNMARSFVETGHKVDVLTLEYGDEGISDDKDGVSIFRIKPDLRLRLNARSERGKGTMGDRLFGLAGRALSKTEKLVHGGRFPLASARLARRICDEALKLHAAHPYDLVVAMYWPAECVHAALFMKEECEGPRYVLFENDAFPPDSIRHLPTRTAQRACRTWATDVYDGFDKVLVLPGNEDWFSRLDVRARMGKVKVVGIPMLVSPSVPKLSGVCEVPLDPSVENWVYSGALDDVNYDAEGMIEMFFGLPEDKERRLYVMTGSRPACCERAQVESGGKVRLMGYLPHDELMAILSQADVLVSTKRSDRISGKIFEYMGLKKPIVHLSGCTEDPDVKYLERCPLAVIVKTYEQGTEERCRMIVEQLSNLPAAEHCDLSALKEFTPEYTRDVLLSIAEKRA